MQIFCLYAMPLYALSLTHSTHFFLDRSSQDAGKTEPNGAKCALPQGLAALRQVLVQPARQEDPQEGQARREGQAGKIALKLCYLQSQDH